MSLIFFADRDLGKQFPDILKTAGLKVERHADHFEHDAPDEAWLRFVGERGWVAVSHDRRIRHKPNEKGAVIKFNVRLLVAVGKVRHSDLAKSFVATIPKIKLFLERHPAPLIAKVYRASPKELDQNPNAPGRIELWYPQQR